MKNMKNTVNKTPPGAVAGFFLLAAITLPFSTPPAFSALNISPETVTTSPGATVVFSLPAGTIAHSNDPGVARFNTADGTLRALSPGRAVLSFRNGDDYATVPVLVRQESPRPPAPPPQAREDSAPHPIDAAVGKKLDLTGVAPSGICTDSEYLRRVCLDLMGALPPVEKTREFLADTDPLKRDKLLDWIFERSEYADYWAMKWCDVLRVKSEYPSNLWPNAVQTYHAWLRAAMSSNMRCDNLARALLTTAGSNFRNPPCNFYRATQQRTPEGYAAAFALIFLGARLECANCTEHPYQTWTHAQADGLAAFFTNIKIKKTGEWKEEIVYFTPNWDAYKPDGGKTVAPVFPDGSQAAFSRTANPQKLLLAWLTSPDNQYFARHIANRHWAALFGRGITMPVDDVRPGNPPSNPELLDTLAAKFIESGFNLRELLRFIVTSQTYQRSSVPNETNATDTQNFSRYRPRRLDAEVLADAIGTATGMHEAFNSRIPEPIAYWPDDFHSVQNPDASVTTGFLETFGRPGRDTSYEVERDRNPSMAQALYLLDSEELAKKLENKNGPIRDLVKKHGANHAALAVEIFLSLLARPPTDGELEALTSHMKSTADKNKAAQDIVWALINTKEFLYNH